MWWFVSCYRKSNKIKLREVKQHVQGHIASNWQRQALSPRWCEGKVTPLPLCLALQRGRTRSCHLFTNQIQSSFLSHFLPHPHHTDYLLRKFNLIQRTCQGDTFIHWQSKLPGIQEEKVTWLLFSDSPFLVKPPHSLWLGRKRKGPVASSQHSPGCGKSTDVMFIKESF